MPTKAQITLPDLEQYLARAADLLRGSIDQADFKAYIFPLMFFKRIGDVYIEEFQQALDASARRLLTPCLQWPNEGSNLLANLRSLPAVGGVRSIDVT